MGPIISLSLKTSIFGKISHKLMAAALVTMFVAAGALVGYVNQFQAAVPGPPTQGLVGYGNLASAPSLVTFAATTYSSTGMPPNTYTTSYGGRMVELQAYLTIQTEDAKTSSDKAIVLASSLGGYVAESSFDDAASSSNLVLRIPQENFTLALRQLANLGTVKAQSISSNDVTEQYVNLQAELDAYKTEELTLLRILNSSNTVKDALATEDTIRDAQAEINQIEGQLRVMERLVAFATFNIQLIPPEKGPSLDFGDALQSAILSFYVVVKGMMIVGASVLPIALVGGVAYYPYHRYSKKRQKPVEAKVNARS
jgi:hypothetical protein